MKTIFHLRFFCATLWISLFVPNASAQFFENTFGNPLEAETTVDGKPLPNGKFIVLGNLFSGSTDKILLTELDPATVPPGKVSMNAPRYLLRKAGRSICE